MGERRTALVIGASGGAGGEVARALLAHGWQVRALTRTPRSGDGIAWVPGDAMRADDVRRAAAGAGLIFHGANPPGYRNWRGLALPMLRNAAAAAVEQGARLILPGNIYNYGPDAGALLSETSPQHPLTRKGAVRVEMEQMLASTPGLRAIVLRAGDFFGGRGNSSWFSAAMVRPGRPLRRVVDPSTPGVGHAWAYLPDLAETVARLAEIEAGLLAFETFHFGGHWTGPGRGMAEAIRRASGNPDLPIRPFAWPPVWLGAPFVTFLREMIEMRYLWRVPLRLDNAKLVACLGSEPHTPLDTAVRQSLAALGCLGPAAETLGSGAALAHAGQ